MLRISLFLLLCPLLAAADAVAPLLYPVTKVNITNRGSLLSARDEIQRAVDGFDKMDIKALRTNRSYATIGTVYTYHAMLLPESDIDARIHAYERALALRKDPDSIYNLATCYKRKYNDAVAKGDMSNEVAFGKKIYHELDMFLKISPSAGRKVAERRDYFRIYLNY
ncbi:MAG: hypothetical protein AABZ39_20365 [Spirochaetota bacterium]